MSRFTDLIQSIETELNDSTVDFVVGNDQQRKRGQRRRIHWYRRGGPITSAKRTGGGDIGGTRRVATPWQREGVIEAHIFSENDDTTEQLTDNLISAIFNTNNTGVTFFDFEWDDDQINQRSCYCIVRFSINTPVTVESLPLVFITGQQTEKEYV